MNILIYYLHKYTIIIAQNYSTLSYNILSKFSRQVQVIDRY